MRYLTGDQGFVRELNLSSLMRYLHKEAPLSRAKLASMTGLNKSTVSSLVDELLARRLIHETGTGTSGAGRPATLLEINPQAGCIIGVELSVDFTSVVVSDFSGQFSWRLSHATDTGSFKEVIIANALEMVIKAEQFCADKECRLLGVGLTVPGLVEVETGVLRFSPNLQWREVPLGNIFHKETGLPTFVDNDANAAALGEHLFGVARQSRNFIFVVAGVGVGGGLFLNGDIYRGVGGFAGEIGHTSVSPEQTRPCRCGNRGCWESTSNQYSLLERLRLRLEIGRQSLVTQLMARSGSPLTLEILAQAADQGDLETLTALQETGLALGLGVANLINIFNPEIVVIGGTMSVVSQHLLPAIQAAANQRAMPEPCQQVQVVNSAFGVDANLVGSVALVVEAILANPARVARAGEERFKEVQRST